MTKFYIWFDRDDSSEDGFGWLVGENAPDEMAYTHDCLEIEIDPADMDRHAKAQGGQDIWDYLAEQDISYKALPEYSKVYTGTVVYDTNTCCWGLLEDLDSVPTVTHWDGSNMQYHTLTEGAWQEVVEVEGDPVCIDRWDGQNMTTGGTGNHAHVYKTTDGRYVLVLSSQWQGSKDSAAVFTAEELRSHLAGMGRAEEADAILGEERKEKQVGMQVRLPESLHKKLKKKLIDDNLTIQELFREAVDAYLKR